MPSLPARLATVAATSIVVIASTPISAWAHSRLLHTSPADGATITEPAAAVVLTFNEMVSKRFTTVVVTGPDDAADSRGGVQVVDTAVTQPIYALHSGAYHVAWRAVSADGHPVQGEFRFTVALSGKEPTAVPPRPVPASSTKDTRWWPWPVGAAALLVAVLALVVLVRRRPR
jgi:methionine-rich copper-binding protein CopC